jgi:hypothetical protein
VVCLRRNQFTKPRVPSVRSIGEATVTTVGTKYLSEISFDLYAVRNHPWHASAVVGQQIPRGLMIAPLPRSFTPVKNAGARSRALEPTRCYPHA